MFKHLIVSATLLMLSVSCSKKSKVNPNPGYPITIGEAIQQDVPIYISSIGNVFPDVTVLVRPQVGGVVTKSYIKDGQHVKQGDPLYQIDPRPFQANLEKAKAAVIKDKATLEFNQTRLNRYSDLVKQEYFAKVSYEEFVSDLENSRGQLLSDESDVSLAELNLEWSTPRSPIDGKISITNIQVGNLIVANDANAITDIRKLDPADIRFTITQSDFVDFQNALNRHELKFFVYFSGQQDKKREGTIFFVDNHVDINTGSILIRGHVDNADEYFWPGEFIRVLLQVKEEKGAILVPGEAVQTGQNGPYLYVYRPETSTVEYRQVDKGQTVDNKVIINKGVLAGEKVVTKGQVNLRNKAKVYLPK